MRRTEAAIMLPAQQLINTRTKNDPKNEIESVEDYVNLLLASFEEIEVSIEDEIGLTEEEKLEIISTTSMLTEIVPILADEMEEYFVAENSGARSWGLFNFLKKIVNGIATVVHKTIINAIPAAFIGLGWGPYGAAVGAAIGGSFGFMIGVSCVGNADKDCYTCVFATSNSGDSCYR